MPEDITSSGKKYEKSIFFHPDFTVGPGVSPDHAARQLADFTAGWELRRTLTLP